MPHSDFLGDDEVCGTSIVTSIRKGFDELSETAVQLRDCIAEREHATAKLERAARALVKASRASDARVARQLLAEALDAAKDGLAEIDGPEAAATKARELETAAD